MSVLVLPEILVGVITLFLKDAGGVEPFGLVVAHQIGFRGFCGPHALNDDAAKWQLRGFQPVIHPKVFAGRIVLAVVAVTDVERAICIFVVDVMGARLVDEGVHLILLSIPVDIVDTHSWVAGVEHLVFVVFVTRIENELLMMLPSQSVGLDE